MRYFHLSLDFTNNISQEYICTYVYAYISCVSVCERVAAKSNFENNKMLECKSRSHHKTHIYVHTFAHTEKMNTWKMHRQIVRQMAKNIR